MQPQYLVADIELEKIILSKILHYCFIAGSSVGLSENDTATLHLAITMLTKDNGSYFNLTINSDIFKYIQSQIQNGIFPNAWQVIRHLQKNNKYKSQQNTITTHVNQLLERVDISLLSLDTMPLIDLVNNLIEIDRIKTLNSKLGNGINSKEDIENIKELLFDIESPNVRDRISRKLIDFQTAKDPITKIESKRAIRMMGFSPQEVSEVTDNYTPPRPTPRIISALDFLNKKFSDATWIYPGLIKAGVVNLVTGQGGSGKTMFCYDAMMCFLGNTPFIGEVPSILASNPKNRGLIINADQPAVDAQEMIKSNPRAWKLARDGKFDLMESDWCLADILHLEMLLKDGIYNFIVIDSYKAIHSHLFGWDENHPSASMGIKELQRLCSVYNVTMLLVHHAGTTSDKGRHKSRGHSSIPDTASSVLSLSASIVDGAKGDPNIRFLDISKTRNAERSNLTLKFNPLDYSYELLPDTKGQERGRINTLANNLMIEFRKGFPHSIGVDELLKKVNGVNDRKGSLAKALQKLEQRGMIEKEVDPNSNEFYYKLVASQHTNTFDRFAKPNVGSPVDAITGLDPFDDF